MTKKYSNNIPTEMQAVISSARAKNNNFILTSELNHFLQPTRKLYANLNRALKKELALRNRILKTFLVPSDEEMYFEILKIILETTGSKFGVLGYIDEENTLVIPTMTRHIWDKCRMKNKSIKFPFEKWGESTWARAILEKITILSNSASKIVPKGHIAIIRHISLPILFRDQCIGLIQVANKDTDYTQNEIALLENISRHIAPILSARLEKEKREKKILLLQQRLLAKNKSELKESELRFHTIADAAHDAIVILNEKGLVSFWNRAAELMFGYSRVEILGKNLHLFIAPSKHHQDYKKGFKEFSRSGSGPVLGKTIELEGVKKNGELFPAELSVSVLKVGNTNHALGIVRNVSDKKRREEEELRREKLFILGLMAGAIAHEIRNPLNSIKNAAYILYSNFDQYTIETREMIDIITKEISNASKTIERILVFAKTDKIIKESTDIKALLDNLLSNITIPENIQVKLTHQKDFPIITTDPVILTYAAGNIIKNALEAMEKEGILTITYELVAPDRFCMTIHNTGPAIPKPKLGHLFKPLHSSKPDGIGLGLSSSKLLIDAQGGNIVCNSSKEKGTTFSITLPSGQDNDK